MKTLTPNFPALALFVILFLAVAPCFADQVDMARLRLKYECEKKAAEYTYNLDKAGDKELFDKHVRDCMAVAPSLAPQVAPQVAPPLTSPAPLLPAALPSHPKLLLSQNQEEPLPQNSHDAVFEIKNKTYVVSASGIYKYNFITIRSGGTLRFKDADTDNGSIDLWTKSILVEDGGTLEIGTQDKPLKRNVTLHLYGSDKENEFITCESETCIPDTLKNGDNIVLTGVKGQPTDTFYTYNPLITESEPKNGTRASYFGRKVIAVSYGGTLLMFGNKGVDNSVADNSSGKSWVRLDGNIQKGDRTIKVDRDVDWSDGDRIVVTTTDYLPGHNEQFEIKTRPGDKRTFDLTTPVRFPHNGTRYDLANRNIPDAIITRWANQDGESKNKVETRAAVALLSRNIKIVSKGTKLDESLPNPACDSANISACDTDRYFGGHMIARQGFKQFQMQGVELYQMGQGGRMAHVPINFFLTRKVPDNTFVKDCSIWDSMNHWIELRGTQGVTLQRNVGYLSIGHGFVLADGAESDNSLLANIGIYARPGADYRDNPRKVPGVLSRRTLALSIDTDASGTIRTYTGKADSLVTSLTLGGDLFNPSPFFIMNAYNTINDNMAAGAGGCGSCYWYAPAMISAFSKEQKFEGMAEIQRSTPGAAPIKSFKGNFCSTAMHSLLTVGAVGTCQGFAKHAGKDSNDSTDPAIPAIKNDLAEKYYTPNCVDTYKTALRKWNVINLTEDKIQGLTDEYCPANDTDNASQRKTPLVSDGAFLQAKMLPDTECSKSNTAGCGVNVIDAYTSSYHWAETNFSAIWLRTFWFLFTDSFLSDVQNGGLTMVSGGSYDQVPIGYWGLTRKSVFAGATQPENPFATASGPKVYTGDPFGNFTSGENLYCTGTPAAYCLLKYKKAGEPVVDEFEGISFQTSNLSGFQRLINIYDGPVYLDSVAFLDIKKTSLDKCSAPTNKAEKLTNEGCKGAEHDTDINCYSAKNCANTGFIWNDNRIYPVPVDKDDANYIPYGGKGFDTNKNKCILPNAAIGWKQPNGFYYPPAFHMRGLYFNNVDIRHFVLVPPFKPGTMQTDFERLSTEYCAYSPGTFADFTDIDRQTQINDDDGSLSGIYAAPAANAATPANYLFSGSIALNNDTFYYAPNRMFESVSQRTCLQTPFDHLNLAIIPSGTYNSTDIYPDTGVPGVWHSECQNHSCSGALIYRQYRLNDDSKDDAWGDTQGIRMMGAGISQRSVMLADKGKYYIDTAYRDTNPLVGNKTYFNGSDDNGLKYNFFLLYAKPTSKVTFQLYVGPGFVIKDRLKKIRVNTKNITAGTSIEGTSDSFTVRPDGNWTDAEVSNKTVDYDGKGILTVTMNMNDTSKSKAFTDAAQESCKPAAYCTWNNGACAPVPCTWDDKQGCSPSAYCTKDKNANACSPTVNDPAICSDWATKTPECPAGGCYGFQITFPKGFETLPDLVTRNSGSVNKLRPNDPNDLFAKQTTDWPDKPFVVTRGGAEASFVYFSQEPKERLVVSFTRKADGGKTMLQANVLPDGAAKPLTLTQKTGSESEYEDGPISLKLIGNSAEFTGIKYTFKGTLFVP